MSRAPDKKARPRKDGLVKTTVYTLATFAES